MNFKELDQDTFTFLMELIEDRKALNIIKDMYSTSKYVSDKEVRVILGIPEVEL